MVKDFDPCWMASSRFFPERFFVRKDVSKAGSKSTAKQKQS